VPQIRIVAAGVLLVAALAACSSSESPSPTQSTSAATQEATASPEPTEEQQETPATTAGAGDLVDVLPEKIGDISMTYQSMSGIGALGGGELPAETADFFDRVGADPNDLSSAFGSGTDLSNASNPKIITLVAIRVAGADEGRLRDEFLAAMESGSTGQATEQTVGGKDVVAFGSDVQGVSTYMYVKGDVIYILGASDADLAEDGLAALP
jgi:hypothetical protein